MTKEYSPYPFRMPNEMRESLELKAKSAGRSLQQEMLKRIDLTLRMEGLFSSKVSNIDTLWDFIMQSISNLKNLETQNTKLIETVNELQERTRILVQTTKVTDDQRFDMIRRNLVAARELMEKMEQALPPAPKSVKDQLGPYNPNR